MILSVWFDLDGVLVDSDEHVERIIQQEFGIPFKHAHYYASNQNLPPHVHKRVRECFGDPAVLGAARANLGAQHVLRNLSKYCQVGILTLRPPDERSLAHTYSQCLSLFGIEPVMVWGKDNRSGIDAKIEALRELGVNVYIEDHLENANRIADELCPCYLVEKNYNQGDISPYVIRVPSLLEFEEAILQKIIGRAA